VSSELKSQIESDPNGYAAFHLHIDHFTREQLLELVRRGGEAFSYIILCSGMHVKQLRIALH
jgi:hypothetical protein